MRASFKVRLLYGVAFDFINFARFGIFLNDLCSRLCSGGYSGTIVALPSHPATRVLRDTRKSLKKMGGNGGPDGI